MKNEMKNREVINEIALKTSYSKTVCSDVVDALREVIMESLMDGIKVKLRGFIDFDVVQRGERKGRNPQTNEVVTFPPARVVKVKLNRTIKDRVKNG